ncbi:MAG: hypothetical protein JO090_12600 [Rhizobacter sp.]|nr:hypothetical protein [Rhizobacter sp.]
MTHVALPVEFPAFVEPIRLGAAQAEGALNLRDLAPEWEPHHPVLGGLAGTFAMKNHVLANHPGAGRVGVCQYRKFVSTRRLSRAVAPSYRSMDVVDSRRLSQAVLADVMLPDADWLLPPPLLLSSRRRRMDILEQYGRAHQPQDLLRFVAEAVEQQLLDKAEVSSLLGEELLLPGGIELGVFPAEFWIRTVVAIESVVRACVRRYDVVRPGYDARAWAFCSERLGSYLVLRHVRALTESPVRLLAWRRPDPAVGPRHLFGHLNLISQGGADYVIGI